MQGPPDLAAIAALVCKQLNYALVKELGSGAHKRAYLIQRDPGTRFALKIAPVTASLKPRFEREAAALSGCSHPSIALLHDSRAISFGDRELWVSVEEFLDGGTLAERQPSFLENPSAVKKMGISLAEALDHLRIRNLVHRDIKPANIMFRSEGAAVLTDFGIVRVLDAPTLTQDFLPQGPGTPLYAAAEQLLNEKTLIDWRTDQFCLALVLAESAIGLHPFAPEKDLPLAVARVARREPLPRVSVNKLEELGLAPLVDALAPWPALRYRFPKDLINALSVV